MALPESLACECPRPATPYLSHLDLRGTSDRSLELVAALEWGWPMAQLQSLGIHVRMLHMCEYCPDPSPRRQEPLTQRNRSSRCGTRPQSCVTVVTRCPERVLERSMCRERRVEHAAPRSILLKAELDLCGNLHRFISGVEPRDHNAAPRQPEPLLLRWPQDSIVFRFACQCSHSVLVMQGTGATVPSFHLKLLVHICTSPPRQTFGALQPLRDSKSNTYKKP